MDKFKVGVLGSQKRQGKELIRILLRHPIVELVAISSQDGGEPLSPNLYGFCELDPVSEREALELSDVVFNADTEADCQELAVRCLENNCILIDLGTTFRLSDEQRYFQWYGRGFDFPSIHGEAVGGLPELIRDRLEDKVITGVTGGIATAACIALAPAIFESKISLEGITVDVQTSRAECSWPQNIYSSEQSSSVGGVSVGTHPQTAEIEEMLSMAAQEEVTVSLSTYHAPLTRGMLVTCRARLSGGAEQEELTGIYQNVYADEPFVRVLPQGSYADTRWVAGSNMCDLSLHVDKRVNTAVICVALDNLVKGAAGQAVQCMNIMLSIPETLGLDILPLY